VPAAPRFNELSDRTVVGDAEPASRSYSASQFLTLGSIAVMSRGRSRREHGVASLIVRRLSEATKERLRQRAARHRRSLEAEVRAILERAAQETVVPSAEDERFPDWFIRMTRPGIDLDEAIEENRKPHEGLDL
jgi:hypothetical protein